MSTSNLNDSTRAEAQTRALRLLPDHLCIGYAVFSRDVDGTPREAHYAVLKSGTTLEAAGLRRTVCFGRNSDGDKPGWKVVAAAPADAEYIGTYPVPAGDFSAPV